jgi:hypothetical protein
MTIRITMTTVITISDPTATKEDGNSICKEFKDILTEEIPSTTVEFTSSVEEVFTKYCSSFSFYNQRPDF